MVKRSAKLTEGFEDVRSGVICVVPVGLVPFRALLAPLPLLLVARLASVAPPPVVALGNVHANVHGVVTCHGTTGRMQITFTVEKGNDINPEPPLIHIFPRPNKNRGGRPVWFGGAETGRWRFVGLLREKYAVS